ncbi:hypothetical protein GQ55_5G003300 [Panicum hallii var. hallii]|uniref:HTH myb-type domain-containing protein n=1 Tax=Panicum hallii var. hallii TaxID=1504633 RepID=A0A2T7DB31_9POAL|nr:hypothetical protein GQ55_5G003300 [Panicum hallii var. hallii]
MGEEAVDDYDLHLLGGGDDERVMEWETGLPGADELTPLSQPLVPPGLAAAFRIPPEPGRTLLDVHRASAATVSRLRRASAGSGSFQPFLPQHQHQHQQHPAAAAAEAADSSAATNSSKRPRLVWTPQLHKRFVDVVAHLGIKNAVPKTIMQLMNVEGLTRENVASHLQKYRLYVKRMQGLSNEGPSPSDHIFASTPVPHSLVHEPQAQVPAPPMYHHSIPMPMGVAAGGMVPTNNGGAGYGYGYGYGYHHQQQQQEAYHHHHHRAGDK